MANSVISSITLPSGTTYDLKDAWARDEIEDIKTITTGAMYYIGISSTEITDDGTQNPTIDGVVKTMDADDAGAVCIYGEMEFVWNGAKWQEFGSTGSLKALAFKDSASGTYTPSGTVSQPTFTGESADVSITATNDDNGNYTPSGTVGAPAISVKTAGATSSVTPIASVGTLPELTTSVSGETLTLSFSQGTLPTMGADVTVKTGDAEYEASQPSFSGTKVQLSGSTTARGSVSQPTFAGTQGSVTVE